MRSCNAFLFAWAAILLLILMLMCAYLVIDITTARAQSGNNDLPYSHFVALPIISANYAAAWPTPAPTIGEPWSWTLPTPAPTMEVR